MINRDTLWKGIIEDLTEDLLHFFFPDFVEYIDFSRGYVFLDKELQKLFPDSESKNSHADKLIKIWLISGEEYWVLLHIEIQGYPDKHFAGRMFQYAYRIIDKFQRPVAALAIYTDDNEQYHPNEYHFNMLGTSLTYRFNVFKLNEYNPETHPLAKGNAFAWVLAVAKAGMHLTSNDKNLGQHKLNMIRKLLENGFSAEKIRVLLDFIRFYVHFENSEESANFENTLETLIQNRKNMGIEEAILTEVKQQGIEQGVQLQKQQIILKGIKEGLSVPLLASLTELSEEEVQQIIQQQG